MNPDPYYQLPPARWMTTVTTSLTGLDVIVDQALPDDLACRFDHRGGLIQVVPGLSLADYQWVLSRTVLLDRFGPDCVPEFGAAQRQLRLVRAVEGLPGPCPTCGEWGARAQVSLS
jgi:hypothetical protein